jgi:protein TonB
VAEVSEPIISSEPKAAATPAPVATSLSSALATAKAAAAAAPAKVKEYAAEERPLAKIDTVDPILQAMEEEESGTVGSTPSFSALELDHSGKQGGGKKILIGAVVLVALAALGYFGWTWVSQRKATTSPTPVSVIQPSSEATPSVATPAPVVPAPSTAVSQPASIPASQAPVKTEKSGAVPRIEINSEPETKAPTVAPLVVKSKPGQKKATADDAGSPLPNPLAVADANPNTLNSLVAPSAAKPQQPTLATLNISQGISQGLLIKRVEPKYPPLAQTMHVQGAVILDATISREGNISNLKLVKGDQVLAHAAIEAVRQWRYKPYYLNGKPVEVQTQITINFKLPN